MCFEYSCGCFQECGEKDEYGSCDEVVFVDAPCCVCLTRINKEIVKVRGW